MSELLARFVAAFKRGIEGEVAAMQASSNAFEITLTRGAKGQWNFSDLLSTSTPAAPAAAADNTLSDQEKKDGWRLLFDGHSLDGWQTSAQQPSKTGVEEGALNPHGCGGYMLIHKEQWENFRLALDFKLSKACNSGVFVRTSPLTPRMTST